MITYNIDFTASNFQLTAGSLPFLPPYNVVSGLFSVTFDPTTDYVDQTSGITGTTNLPLDGALAFTYHPAYNQMIIGGFSDWIMAADSVGGGTDDFALVLMNDQFNELVYATATTEGASFWTLTGTVSIVDPSYNSVVPISEPASIGLLLAAIAIAVLHRNMRRVIPWPVKESLSI